MRRTTLVAAAALLAAAPVFGQSLSDRIAHIRQQRSGVVDPDRAAMLQRQRATAARLFDIIDRVQIENASARDALDWWSRTTGAQLVVDWNALENEGIYPEAPIDLQLSMAPANRALELLLRQIAPDAGWVYEVEPGYVQVMTKAQANRQLVTAVYDVGDLLMEIPDFEAPSFDLRDALSNTNSGGGGSGGGLFGDEDDDDPEEQPLSRVERGEQLAQLVRDTVEPGVWQENGGTAMVRYFRGMLIVRAPKYVQRQIGTPVRSADLPSIGGSVAGG